MPAITEQQQQIIDILADVLCIDRDEITPSSHLERDFDCDEIDQIDIVTELEYEFEFDIPDEDFQKLWTVQGIFDYIAAHTNS